MTEGIDNYVKNFMLNEKNIENFYEILKQHNPCKEDYKLNTQYAIDLFITTLFKYDNGGCINLDIPYVSECELYQHKDNGRLEIFRYVCSKAVSIDNIIVLRLIVKDFRNNKWSRIFGYYVYNKTKDLLSCKKDSNDIKKKIYDIITSLKKQYKLIKSSKV